MTSMYHVTNALLQTRAEINNVSNEIARLNNLLVEYRANERRFQRMIDDEIRASQERWNRDVGLAAAAAQQNEVIREKTVAISKKRMDEVMPDKCGICIEFHKKSDTVRTCCGHDFGHECFDTWAATCKRNGTAHVSCPACRAKVTEITSFRRYASRAAAAAPAPAPALALAPISPISAENGRDDFDGTDDFITRMVDNLIDISDIDAELENRLDGRILADEFWQESV